MQVYVVIMLVPDDSDDNTQNMGVFAKQAAANAFANKLRAEGMDITVETWDVQ